MSREKKQYFLILLKYMLMLPNGIAAIFLIAVLAGGWQDEEHESNFCSFAGM